jgi:hypothetical protein
LPIFVTELPELLFIIKRRGNTALKKGASAHLTWEFAIKPLLSDLHKIANFKDALDKRSKELHDLRTGKGLRRRVFIHEDMFEGSPVPDYVLVSNPPNAWTEGSYIDSATRRMWASITWKPAVALDTSFEETDRFRKILWGLDPSQLSENIWNRLPWTWLIDWAFDVSSYLRAANNSIAYLLDPVCVMKSYEGSRVFTITSFNNNLTRNVEKPSLTRTAKRRRLAYPSVVASIPYLDGRQLSILGSLSILKGS